MSSALRAAIGVLESSYFAAVAETFHADAEKQLFLPTRADPLLIRSRSFASSTAASRSVTR